MCAAGAGLSREATQAPPASQEQGFAAGTRADGCVAAEEVETSAGRLTFGKPAETAQTARGQPVSIAIEVVQGDVFAHRADVLALKYARQSFGVDRRVVSELSTLGVELRDRLPAIGEALLVESKDVVPTRDILFVGVVPLGRFDYEAIRVFAGQVLATLQEQRPATRHVAMTLHGAGYGLDEAEAFRAEIAGLLDAVQERRTPGGLRRISIVERHPETATRMQQVLEAVLPGGVVDAPGTIGTGFSLSGARSGLESVGRDSRGKPLVFVAMPFADEYADRFHYGIRGAVNAAGFLCERADLSSFTGDVIAWVKERIGNAALVVADLTTANPNVYLEVGYAWGRGVNTILLLEHGDALKFDVRTQRCLIFRSIRHLEELLTTELTALRAQVFPGLEPDSTSNGRESR